ncbi:hypothetical protein LCGC14_1603760 [marine sediment metagenome]|uniref:Uncharacterized protein n=1 Tax=marine sediment metagenome TaxID=412755 RepID=A0A0F9IAS6_9ZZZZ
MSDRLNMGSEIGAQITQNRGQVEGFDPKGKFHAELWRGGKCIHREEFANGITDEGKKKIFDLYFLYADVDVPNGTTEKTYIGLVNTGSTLASGDTYVTHAGWTEFTSYTVSASAKRGEWTAGAATGAGTVSITNASPVTFDFTGSGTVDGIFVVSGTTTEIEVQSNVTAGNILWSTGDLAAPLAVVSADQLKITYTVNA